MVVDAPLEHILVKALNYLLELDCLVVHRLAVQQVEGLLLPCALLCVSLLREVPLVVKDSELLLLILS